MKKLLFAVLVLSAFIVFAKIGGPSAIQGYISSIDVQKEVTTATISVRSIPSSEIPHKIKPGMSVRLIHSIQTAQFRLPIGRILSVENGVITAGIDKALLERDFENPYTHEKIKVKTIFTVGAEVSISGENT